MSKIWSPTRPLCSPVVLGPGARTVTRWSTGRLLMPVTPTPLAGFGSGTARLTETILPTPRNLAAPANARPAISRHPPRRNDVRRLRLAGNLSQAQLADAVKVSRQTINSIETGRYTPSLPLAIALARFFARPVEETAVLWRRWRGFSRGSEPGGK